MSKAGVRILRGIAEARRFARGEATEGLVVHALSTLDVKAIRDGLGMSRAEFATRFGFSETTIERWEAGHQTPRGPERAYLRVIEREPDAVARALADA